MLLCRAAPTARETQDADCVTIIGTILFRSQLLNVLSHQSIRAHCMRFVGSGFRFANAQESAPIKFDGYPPPMPVILGNAWFIFADGIIDSGATQRLRDFLVSNRVPSRSSL
jgi:hypothetical protein